ncbi:MAG: hypothetical protein K8S87_12605 [Planctomycetes bacterium]|nr:hypothetical protein [Planctomycetota bacterium]
MFRILIILVIIAIFAFCGSANAQQSQPDENKNIETAKDSEKTEKPLDVEKTDTKPDADNDDMTNFAEKKTPLKLEVFIFFRGSNARLKEFILEILGKYMIQFTLLAKFSVVDISENVEAYEEFRNICFNLCKGRTRNFDSIELLCLFRSNQKESSVVGREETTQLFEKMLLHHLFPDSVKNPKLKQEVMIPVKEVEKQIDELKKSVKINGILVNIIVGLIALIIGLSLGFVIRTFVFKQ